MTHCKYRTVFMLISTDMMRGTFIRRFHLKGFVNMV